MFVREDPRWSTAHLGEPPQEIKTIATELVKKIAPADRPGFVYFQVMLLEKTEEFTKKVPDLCEQTDAQSLAELVRNVTVDYVRMLLADCATVTVHSTDLGKHTITRTEIAMDPGLHFANRTMANRVVDHIMGKLTAVRDALDPVRDDGEHMPLDGMLRGLADLLFMAAFKDTTMLLERSVFVALQGAESIGTPIPDQPTWTGTLQ